jgi:hypothetical protein
VISQIPEGAGDPMRARAQALTLAGLFDEQQLRQLQVSQARGDADRQEQIRALAGKSDISTPEGLTQFASAATRIDPKMGLDLYRQADERRLSEAQATRLKLEFQANEVGPAAVGLLDTLHTKGIAQMGAEYQQQVPAMNERLRAMGLPPLPAQFPASDPQQAEAILRAQAGHSETALRMLSQQRADRSEGERERHDRAMEARGLAASERAGQHVETIMGPDKKPRRVLFDNQGNVVKDLGEAPAGRGEHPTEAETKSAVNYTTMKNAESVLESPKYRNMNLSFLSDVEEDENGVLHAVTRFGRRIALTPDQQVLAQAAGQFAEGAGHLKSGARINKDTMRLMLRLYVPLPGDSDEVKARKLKARRNDLAAGRVGSGRALESIEKAQAAEEGTGGAAPASGWGEARVVGQ